MGKTSTIALLAALPAELAPTLHRLGMRRDAPRRRHPRQRVATSERDGVTIDAYLSGMGRTRVETCLDAMLNERPPHYLIHLGFAGGLSPQLDVGDIIEPSVYQHPDTYRPPPGGRSTVVNPLTRTLLTVDQPVLNPVAKSQLYDAQGCPDAVDMEAYHAMQFLRRAGAGHIDYIAIRAITDRYDQAVPAALMHWVDGRGRPRPARIALDLLRQPSLMRDAHRLRATATTAAVRLAERAEERLNEIIDRLTV